MPTLSSRYEVIETLGTGATSRVEKAVDTLIGRTVALKTFQCGFGSHQLREQFLREAQIIGQLAHPSIVSLYDVGTDANGLPYFVMEFVEGETLEKALETGALPAEKAAAWGGDLATALARAHQAKIIHGDVKPANILITKEGRPKLGDFGIARYATQISPSGSVNGTPAFLAPEQIRDQVQDARSDLFSLGIVLYQMTTGTHPFDGSSVSAVCGQIISTNPAPPSHHNPALPREFDEIVMRCLAKNPDERFATADDLAGSLYPLARNKKTQASALPQAMPTNSTTPGPRKIIAQELKRPPARQTARTTTWHAVASWWNRPLRGKDLWVAGATAGILALSLVPLARVLHGHRSSKPAAKPEIAATESLPSKTSQAMISPTDLASSSSALPAERTGSQLVSANAKTEQSSMVASQIPIQVQDPPAKPAAMRHKDSQMTPRTVAAAPQSSKRNNSATKAPAAKHSAVTASNATAPPAIQQTSLNIAVVSDVADEVLAVYADDELLLKAPLDAPHRGDTLRFSCPIAPGDHLLRVVVYRGNQEVLAQKENNSELRTAGSNTMEVHVSRHSKMLVKHQTALEIVWPSRTVASTIRDTTQSASTN